MKCQNLFEAQKGKDIIIIRVNRDLDSYNIPMLKKVLETAKCKNCKILIDLTKVNFINARAIGALVHGSKIASQNQSSLKIFGVSNRVQRTFDLIGAQEILEIHKTREEALASF